MPPHATHILFLTSTNLAANPRCLKEIRLMAAKGYQITVVAFYLHNWTDEKERLIIEELPGIEFHHLETTRRQFFPWLISSLMEKGCRAMPFFYQFSLLLTALAVGKRTWLMLRWAKKWNGRPGLIIAHNPPTFYVAYRLAQRYKALFGLDVEDYHPGESNPRQSMISMAVMMKKLLPKATYVTYASPLIREYCEKLLAPGTGPSLVINNVFPAELFSAELPAEKEKMQVVWFSQNVNAGRGLETMINYMEAFADRLDLTLIGNPIEPFCSELTAGRSFVKLKGPLTQQALCRLIGEFDIGLATEPSKDLNNSIALSNKLWTYFQSGLFILASNTPAQSDFMVAHPDHGVSIVMEKEVIVRTLENLLDRLGEIRAGRASRFERAKRQSWEMESQQLVNTWEEVLQEA